jgi:hypothetical protein
MGSTQGLGLGPPPPDDDHRQNVLDRWIWGRFGWSFVALVITVVFFIFDWGGYRGKFAPWGDPRPLSEVWWHFAAVLSLSSALTYGISRRS